MNVAERVRISFPRLDSLRALCFLSVFFFHSFYTLVPEVRYHWLWQHVKYGLFRNGDLGVNVFFALSGFLITYLLIAEKNTKGRIDVPRFWLRRVLRIWPLYYACVAFGFLVFPWIKHVTGQVPNEVANPWYYLFFASNFDTHNPDSSTLALLWSIAVEEQFYLVWPLVLALVPTRWFPWCFAAVLGQSWVFRYVTQDPDLLYGHTLSCIGDMAMGGIGAWIGSSERGRAWIARWPSFATIGIYLVFFTLYLFRDRLAASSIVGLVFERSCIAAAAVAIILHQCFGRANFLSLPTTGFLCYLGRISYGLYCLHTIGILAAIQILHRIGADTKLWQVLVLQPVVAFSVALGLASISYRFYESPFLRLKERLSFITRSSSGTHSA